MNWEQLRTILWLRWRLTRNQWSRAGGLGAVIAVLVGVGAFVLGGLSFIGALLGGMFGLAEATSLNVLLVWLAMTGAFLLFWLIGLLAELQRSETIDLQRLMHLPVALGQMFVVNYLASHLALSIIVMLPAMLGLAVGLVIARGPAMLLLLPLVLSMVFMITAWTYCLRGWLAAMMSNPRRRRTIIMGITFAFILLGQAPNLYFNVVRRFDRPSTKATTPEAAQRQRAERQAAERQMRDRFFAIQNFIPPLWLPVGARALTEGRVSPAILGTLGCFALGALGLRRAYGSTLRFYRGDPGKKLKPHTGTVPVLGAATAPVRDSVRFLEWRPPLVPEPAIAVALATLRSMLRAPEVKMAWATSFLVTLILGISIFFRSASKLPEVAKPFMLTGATAFSMLMLFQFLANQFGFDRDGFRLLVLSPVERRQILLGKNLAALLPGVCFGLVVLGLVSVGLHLSVVTVVAALFQLLTAVLLGGVLGNGLSILVPYRIQAGSMKPTKMPALAMLTMFLSHLLFPLALAPVFVPPLAEFLWRHGGLPLWVPVNLILSVGLAGFVAFGYWLALAPLGRLLQRRETKILNTITAEVE